MPKRRRKIGEPKIKYYRPKVMFREDSSKSWDVGTYFRYEYSGRFYSWSGFRVCERSSTNIYYLAPISERGKLEGKKIHTKKEIDFFKETENGFKNLKNLLNGKA
jgi:hypothetical protein